jgi:hypothetical protein
MNLAHDSAMWKRVTPELIDAGKRASDLINEKLSNFGWDMLRHAWLAIRLSDGGSDGILYESKQAATRHQLHEQQCYYVCFKNLPGGARPDEMTLMLLFAREAYAAGGRFVDPEDELGGREPLLTTAWHDSLTAAIKRAGIR